jgi:uncharacterized protein (TIGR02217 family)
MTNAFHEVLFPYDVALNGRGGPVRRTDIVTTGSGREERNARWAHARRKYDAGGGVRSLDQLAAVIAFFEERRGRLHGFRFRDRLDHRSCLPSAEPAPTDQPLGTGDGVRRSFQLAKTYGSGETAYRRPIAKPVAGSVRVAVGGILQLAGVDFDLDVTTGLVTFGVPSIPPAGAAVTAGFRFDVPVRFDTDELSIDFAAFAAGEIPHIPLIEIVP